VNYDEVPSISTRQRKRLDIYGEVSVSGEIAVGNSITIADR
jgi:hypothetical protein